MPSLHLTKHASLKLKKLEESGFKLSKNTINKIITKPEKVENKSDGTKIAMTGWDEIHVIRVVYRKAEQKIVVITIYPGRIKQYGLPLRS